MQHSFWGWVPQGPLRTLYQSVWQNVLTWEVQGCGVGERLRRSEFETPVNFRKILSGLSFHPSWDRDHPTHLACFHYVPGPAESFSPPSLCVCCSFCQECPSQIFALSGCPSSHVSFWKILPWPQWQPSTLELLLYYFLSYFYYSYYILSILTAFRNDLFIC